MPTTTTNAKTAAQVQIATNAYLLLNASAVNLPISTITSPVFQHVLTLISGTQLPLLVIYVPTNVRPAHRQLIALNVPLISCFMTMPALLSVPKQAITWKLSPLIT